MLIIDDDFLPEPDIEMIQKTLLTPKISWGYYSTSLSPKYKKLKRFANYEYSDYPQFIHEFYGQERPVSDFYDVAHNILQFFAQKHNITVRAMIRGKCNLVTPSCEKEDTFFPVHTDYNFDHNVLLYYVNDSDGDTIIYNETCKDEHPVNLTEKIRISPESGKAVVFDGTMYHAPGRPKFSDRVVVNIAFV